MTSHPALLRVSSVARSRLTLPLSFSSHHSALVLGKLSCCGHRCQKQPSTNTATRLRVNTMSGRIRPMLGTSMSTRYRSPLRWSSRRIASSGAVWRLRTLLICADFADDGGIRSDMRLTVPRMSYRRANLVSNNRNVICTIEAPVHQHLERDPTLRGDPFISLTRLRRM